MVVGRFHVKISQEKWIGRGKKKKFFTFLFTLKVKKEENEENGQFSAKVRPLSL